MYQHTHFSKYEHALFSSPQHTHTLTYAKPCAFTLIYIYIQTNTHTLTHKHTHTNTHTHIHIYIYKYRCQSRYRLVQIPPLTQKGASRPTHERGRFHPTSDVLTIANPDFEELNNYKRSYSIVIYVYFIDVCIRVTCIY